MGVSTNFSLLRNPMVILGTFGFVLLPEFAFLCSLELPFQPFWSDFVPCSKEFAVYAFVEESLLSLFMIILTFETIILLQRPLRLHVFPDTNFKWLKYQLRASIGFLMAFLIYILFTEVFALITSRPINLAREEISLSLYLIKIVLSGFIAVNAVLLLQHIRSKRNPGTALIKAWDKLSEITLRVDQIAWFEKEGRKYYAYTENGRFVIGLNLRELETKLGTFKFVRINRSAIVNIELIKDYSYWENEKYILRLYNGKEFVVNRSRLKQIKAHLADYRKNGLPHFTKVSDILK